MFFYLTVVEKISFLLLKAVSLPGKAGNHHSLWAEKYWCYMAISAYLGGEGNFSLHDGCTGQNL